MEAEATTFLVTLPQKSAASASLHVTDGVYSQNLMSLFTENISK